MVPEKTKTPLTKSAYRAPTLGGLPLASKAGLPMIGYRLKKLLINTPNTWEEINREEHGSFFSLFISYHLPLLIPFYFFFVIRELLHFINIILFFRHTLIVLPLFTLFYMGYLFLLSIIAEETAELSGGRFTPQSGVRIAIFSSLILSFLSIATLLPVVGIPFLLLGLFWHYRQLFQGARTLLNIGDNHYKMYRWVHVLVWLLLGLLAFVLLSVVSFLFAKLGHIAI